MVAPTGHDGGKRPRTDFTGANAPGPRLSRGLATTVQLERYYRPDRDAMLAALRVVLGLPKAPPGRIEELRR